MNKYDVFLKKAFQKMFQAVGFSDYDEEFVKQSNWYHLREWTQTQSNDFKRWFLKEAKKDLKFSKQMIEREYQWFDLKWGWKVK
jgi:hypothetical protein